jgi:hypothetical protein
MLQVVVVAQVEQEAVLVLLVQLQMVWEPEEAAVAVPQAGLPEPVQMGETQEAVAGAAPALMVQGLLVLAETVDEQR